MLLFFNRPIRYLIKDDIPLHVPDDPSGYTVLSDKEAQLAVDILKEHKLKRNSLVASAKLYCSKILNN